MDGAGTGSVAAALLAVGTGTGATLLLAGATLLTGAHAASQVIVPGVAVPVGILTALVGVPVFLAIIFGRQRSAVRSGS